MPSQENPFIHSYKINVDHRWDQFNALCLIQSRLGFQPQRWHLEGSKRVQTDRFGWTETRRYYRLHAKHNGQWKRRYLRLEDARKLLNLNITNSHNINPKPHQKLKIFMTPTPTQTSKRQKPSNTHTPTIQKP